MKTNRFVFILFLLLLAPVLVKAQQTVYYQSLSHEIQKAKELYLARNYISAISQFEQIASKSGENSDIRAEALFYKALCGLKLDNGNAEEQIADFINKFPESSFRNRALFEQGIYQFDKKKYSGVLKTLEGLNKAELSNDEVIHFHYLRGYSNFELETMDVAASDFAGIKDGNSM